MSVQMRGDKVSSLLKKICDSAGQYFPHTHCFIIDHDSSFMTGDTQREDLSDEIVCSIGDREFYTNPVRLFDGVDVAYAVIDLCHEIYGHGVAIQHEFQNNKPLSRTIALNYFACQGSFQYYMGRDKNLTEYFRQSHEVAAEYSGIRVGSKILVNLFGKEAADDLVCGYVKARHDRNSEFVPYDPDWKTTDDVLNALNEHFYECVYKHHDFHYDSKVADAALSGFCSDLGMDKSHWFLDASDYFDRHYPCKKFMSRIESTKNGLRQDYLAASLCFGYYAEVYHVLGSEDRFAALSGLDMGYQKVFSVLGTAWFPQPLKNELDLRELQDVTPRAGPDIKYDDLDIVT